MKVTVKPLLWCSQGRCISQCVCDTNHRLPYLVLFVAFNHALYQWGACTCTRTFQLTCRVLPKVYLVFCLELPFSQKLGVLYEVTVLHLPSG